jgi:aminoglycoside phosphotransferase family enzyme
MMCAAPGTTLPPVSHHLFDPSRQGAEIVETHISSLVFDGDLVHKRKKPVRFAFVDLSTPERREAVCRREVELNRRFSGDVYLGVEEVLDEAGQVVDHAVVMRRMPADRRLASLVQQHRDVAAWAEDIFCLGDGPRILDGLEFDDRLRWGDVVYDIGFLAMDLEHLGRLDLALAFLDWYRDYTAETHPRSLEHHYIAYRALVRSSPLRRGSCAEVDAAP